MELSEKAIRELREVLKVDIGDAVNEMSDQDLNDFGMFVLTVDATYLKMIARQKNSNHE